MAQCDHCGAAILFGGRREGGRHFCNDTCFANGHLLFQADEIPQEVVDRAIHGYHQGDCPKCGGPGPVDIHTSHSVFSLVAFTSWRSTPQICCRSCGRKSQTVGLVSSMLLGWWGFPFGLIMTPVQICRNLGGMLGGPDPELPSEQLEEMARLDIAERIELGEPIPGVGSADSIISVDCEFCGHTFTVGPSEAGKKRDCPACAERIRIPGRPEGGEVLQLDAWEEVDEVDDYRSTLDADDGWEDYEPDRRSDRVRTPARRRPRKKSGSGLLIVVLAAVFVLVVVPIGIGLAVAVFGDRDEDDDRRFAGNQPHVPQPAAPDLQPPDFGQPNIPFPGEGQAPALPDGIVMEEAPGRPAIPDRPGFTAPNLPPGFPRGGPNESGSPFGNSPFSQPKQFVPEPVPPLQNANPDGPLWVVLSNLREVPNQTGTPIDKTYAVDYQVAQGAPDPQKTYMLRLIRRISHAHEMTSNVSVKVQVSGTFILRARSTVTALPGTMEFVLAEMKRRNEFVDYSGTLKPGQARSEALPPRSVVEVAGKEAEGKPVAIAYATKLKVPGILPTIRFKVVRLREQIERHAVAVMRNDAGDIAAVDITQKIQEAEIGEEFNVTVRLTGLVRNRNSPMKLRIEHRQRAFVSPSQPDPLAVLSNEIPIVAER